VSIVTVPQVAIGQRAILCCTAKGNVLWDCITYLDDDTIRRINDLGGIKAIAISHPHFYTTAVEWAQTFNCPVYYSAEDEEWIMRFAPRVQKLTLQSDSLQNTGGQQVIWKGHELSLLGDEVRIVKTGGHFPGSSVLYWKEAKKLMTADSIFVVPSGLYNVNRPPGTTSFTFMWSYPNSVSRPRHILSTVSPEVRCEGSSVLSN
jgi:glyoxylase-like metal-dependent hydrolase (beta-lactamase superfamily II)